MFGIGNMWSNKINRNVFNARLLSLALAAALPFGQVVAQPSVEGVDYFVNDSGYRLPNATDSEFDNYSGDFVRDWRRADPDHEDTEFGELMYNEASTPTKLEILRLLSKGTPSMTVLMHAIAMGIDIEEVLKATVSYEPEKSSQLTASAVNILPILEKSDHYIYSGYELEDLEREDESKPYRVQEVVEKFFEDRLVLRPYPDWFEGQYHFMASAAELDQLQKAEESTRWYRTKSTIDVSKRPVFVSLYEGTKSVLVDGEDRIKQALELDPNALLPVVFVFNRLNERSIDQLKDYPATIKGVQDAYTEKSLILTPVPEWQLGEYHIYADVSEFYEIFDIPDEEDFEPGDWMRLLEEADDYAVTNTSFLMVILGGRGGDDEDEDDNKEQADVARGAFSEGELYAVWDDPRTEAQFQYVTPQSEDRVTLNSIMGKGIIFNRPDLLAALNALGVKQVPVSFYYVDSTRVRPFTRGARALINFTQGVTITPLGPGGSGGITGCASPPCVEQ